MKSVSKVIFSVVFIWLSVLNTPICSSSAVPTYSITYDKKMENVVEIQQMIKHTAKQLLENVDVNSYEVILKDSLDVFAALGYQVSYEYHNLNIVVGDGLGAVVRGDFQNATTCVGDVKQRSLLKEWLGF